MPSFDLLRNNVNNIFRNNYDNNIFRNNYDNNIFRYLNHGYFGFHLVYTNYNLNWNNLNNNIICDICNKECTSYDKGYSCRECDIDICEECVIKINKTKIMTNH